MLIPQPVAYSDSASVLRVCRLGVELSAVLNEEKPEISLPSIDQLIANSGISSAELAVIKEHSAGIIGVQEFIQKTQGTESSLGTLLGLDASVMTVMSDISQFEDFKAAYERLENEENAKLRTSSFLEELSSRKTPVAFLIPNNLTGPDRHPFSGVTRGELMWYLKNPEAMRYVTFVFGSYDAVPSGHMGLIKEWARRYVTFHEPDLARYDREKVEGELVEYWMTRYLIEAMDLSAG